MKTHTNNYKNEIKKLGKQIDSKIIYQLNGENIELGNSELNSVTPHYEANILKSVMKELDIDSNVEIPVGTIINYKFGVLVGSSYEYLDFGKYIVKEAEKQEDLNSWYIKCCDKMLYAMTDYEKLPIIYPITIKDYIQAICNKLGLAFENASGTFANYDKQIQHELYLSYNETQQDYTDSMGYTFRDVLDELAQATGSTILINNDDKLEIRYIDPITDKESTIEGENTLYLEDAVESNALSYSVDGLCSQDGTPTPSSPVEVKTIPSIINLFANDETKYYRGTYWGGELTKLNNGIRSTVKSSGNYKYGGYLIDVNGLLGKTFTISCDSQSSSSNNGGIRVYWFNGTDLATQIKTLTATGGTFTIPSTSQYNKIAILFYANYNGTGSVNNYVDYTNIMLEESSTAHEYIPYGYYMRVKVTNEDGTQENQVLIDMGIYESGVLTGYYELCKIGNYKDTLSIDSSGNCVINKNVGKVVLNGSESWTSSSLATNTWYSPTTNAINPTTTDTTLYSISNYYESKYRDNIGSSNYGLAISNSSSGKGNVLLRNTDISSASNLKTWLQSHNTNVYYVLNTPETINLSNTQIPLFDGINHITLVDLGTETKITYNLSTYMSRSINEEYLKDVNVNFGEKYGKVNSIVLSRAGDSDRVYLRDEQSVSQNGLCEINISENQIMNWSDRSDYLPDLLEKLDGLEYYLNDFTSTGITYLDPCDRYYVEIGEKTYPCIMFNDEINVTQGLQELVHTDMPQQSETDYTKADKTDRKINQTTLIVDKQNQTIQSVVSNVSEQNNKISQLTQTVGELNSKIQDIADITVAGESQYATFTLDNVNESEPIMIKVRPIDGANNISYLYPNSNLYPSSNLYGKTRTIRFHNSTENVDIDYVLPDDLLYYDSTHFDEFYLDYDSQTCQITKKCKYNADGTIGLLSSEQVVTYPYPTIELTNGDYTLQLLGYQYGYLFVRLMASNIYTSQFATRVEVTSEINQKADEINLEVAKKTNKDEIISTINQTPEQITINANKISLAGKTIDMTGENIAINSTNFQVTTDGNITANNVTLNSGIFKGDINTSQNCIVGDDLIIGSNQSPGNIDVKSISFSSESSIVRGIISGNEQLQIKTPILHIISKDNYGLSGDLLYLTNSSCGIGGLDTQTIDLDNNSIVASTQITIGSDRRLKQEIKDLDASWIDELKVKEFEYIKNPNKKQIGLIAQDYENKDYSKYFMSKNENGYYGIAYGNITNALIQYCQEMKKEIIDLKEEIKKLKESEK